jgi:hypothetical protein
MVGDFRTPAYPVCNTVVITSAVPVGLLPGSADDDDPCADSPEGNRNGDDKDTPAALVPARFPTPSRDDTLIWEVGRTFE